MMLCKGNKYLPWYSKFVYNFAKIIDKNRPEIESQRHQPSSHPIKSVIDKKLCMSCQQESLSPSTESLPFSSNHPCDAIWKSPRLNSMTQLTTKSVKQNLSVTRSKVAQTSSVEKAGTEREAIRINRILEKGEISKHAVALVGDKKTLFEGNGEKC